jgi:glycosyltransferase involved in cell wall biosynthesis
MNDEQRPSFPPVRILQSSFACDPRMASESYVGWNWAKMLHRHVEVHVLTRKQHRPSLEDSPLAGKVVFHYFDLPGCAQLSHTARFIKPYYVLWQLAALGKGLWLHLRYRYRLAHHITYNNLDVPGFLWLLPGAHFVWGPLGGGQVPEDSMRRVYGGQWPKEIARKWLKRFARYNPIVRLALARASLVLFANNDTAARFAGIPLRRSVAMLETAIEKEAIQAPRHQRRSGPLRLLWIGNVIPRKALCLALDALASGVRRYGERFDIFLEVVGGGGELAAMRSHARDLAVDDRVVFNGMVPFAEVGNFFRRADALLFTSVQDTSGNVVLEAMALGLPVIALDHQGPQAILCRGGGILVPVSSYAQTADDLAEAIFNLASGAVDYAQLSVAAVAVVQGHFTWQAKEKVVLQLFTPLWREGAVQVQQIGSATGGGG